MNKIPEYLDNYFKSNGFILLYPKQIGVKDHDTIDLNNPALPVPIEKLDKIGKNIARLLR